MELNATHVFCTVCCTEFVQIYFIELTEDNLPLQNNVAYTVAAPR